MSIQSEITRISGNVSDAFNAVTAKGGTVPTGATSDDLAAAIATIEGGGGLPSGIEDITSEFTLETGKILDTSTVDYAGRCRINGSGSSTDYFLSAYHSIGSTSTGSNKYMGWLLIRGVKTISSSTEPINVCIVDRDPATSWAGNQYFGINGINNIYKANYNYNYAVVPIYRPNDYYYGFGVMIQADNRAQLSSNFNIYYIRWCQDQQLEDKTLTITSNTTSTQTLKPSFGYHGIGTLNYTVNVSADPTTNTYFPSFTSGLIPKNTSFNIDLSSYISNNTTPFILVMRGGRSSGTGNVTFTVKYDGSGQSGSSHFTISILSSVTTNTTWTMSGFSMSSAGVLTMKTANNSTSGSYYPAGSSTGAAYTMCLITLT